MDYKTHTAIETRLLMELTSSKTALDAVMRFLQTKRKMYCGLTIGEVEMLIAMFGEEKENEA